MSEAIFYANLTRSPRHISGAGTKFGKMKFQFLLIGLTVREIHLITGFKLRNTGDISEKVSMAIVPDLSMSGGQGPHDYEQIHDELRKLPLRSYIKSL